MSIFEDVPADLDENWYLGVLVGGMARWTKPADLAGIYKINADALLEIAIQGKDRSYEQAYPVLYLYRHALELYLKAALPDDAKKGHRLDGLIARLEASGNAPENLITILREFASIDPDAQAFRYHDGRGGMELEGEKWVRFDKLRDTMGKACQALSELVPRQAPHAG